ncbi:hypothetical protein LOTGIDRAFT_67017, partial [Lottia gigantea]
QFTCPICLEIFLEPVKISCGNDHVYCAGCLEGYKELAEPRCPQCRNIFKPSQLKKASELNKLLKKKKSCCKWCGKSLTLIQLREHVSSCEKVDTSLPVFKPVKQTSQSFPSDAPNRATFKCPYCGQCNLDLAALVKHCNNIHRDSPAKVVCPVCLSMPWGDPNRTSGNFLQHLNLRHKFEYDTYVDYEQDDEAMLEAALRASLQD